MQQHTDFRWTGLILVLAGLIAGCVSTAPPRPSSQPVTQPSTTPSTGQSTTPSTPPSTTPSTPPSISKEEWKKTFWTNFDMAWSAASKGDIESAKLYINKMSQTTQSGNAPAVLYILARGYLEGQMQKPNGTKENFQKDPVMGYRTMYLSALGGYPLGEARLGMLYEMGDAVSQDLLNAYFWYSVSLRNPKKTQENGNQEFWVLIRKLNNEIRAQLKPHQLKKVDAYLRNPGFRFPP